MRRLTVLFRVIVGLLLFVADVLLKMGIGVVIVGGVWLPFRVFGGYPFGLRWLLAGTVLGAVICSFFDGVTVANSNWAKRLMGEK
jgi:hypothetical protein